jgi:hypothetical protein
MGGKRNRWTVFKRGINFIVYSLRTPLFLPFDFTLIRAYLLLRVQVAFALSEICHSPGGDSKVIQTNADLIVYLQIYTSASCRA